MHHADIMANAYAVYAQNLSTLTTGDKAGILDQLQSFLKSNGAAAPLSGATSLMENTQSMESSSDRDDGVRPACRFCGKTFAQASYIKAHERLHTGEKPYVCSVCNKAFSDASNWKKHERMHSRQIQSAIDDGVVPVVTSAPPTPEPLTPNSPGLSAAISSASLGLGSQLSSFSAHLSAMTATSAANSLHNTPPGYFPDALSSSSNLAASSQNSSINSISSNSIVNLSQNNNSSSNNHSAGRASDFQNVDEAQDLSPPIKKSKDDSLNCNLCGKLFSTPASLSMHKKIHSGEKPHICVTCGKAFTQIGTLRAHERVHTGEKPYECNFCGKTFAQCGSFRMHERRHHRDLVDGYQKCFVCGASFSSMDELQKHMLCHPGALSLGLQNLHPSALGFPSPMPLGFSIPSELDLKCELGMNKSDPPAEMSDIEKAFNLYANQTPKSAPATAVTLSDHFQLPPFASTAHALIQRSLSQGSDPNTAVSMFLASNGADNMSLFNQAYSASNLLSSSARLSTPTSRPERSPTRSHDLIKTEEVEPVSTTTRSRKYSSDSHTSLSNQEAPNENAISQQEDSKMENGIEEDGEAENEPEANGINHKTPSEDSSLAESRSTEDCHSDDQHCSSGGISRRNLNRRMISSTSSNSRKQRRPMRRLSTSGALEPLLYQQQFNEEGEEIIDEEKILKDQMMVSFLLSKGEVYKCEHCHIIFEDCTLYLLHNGFHANDTDPFKCVICKKSCDGRVEFNCHLTSHINLLITQAAGYLLLQQDHRQITLNFTSVFVQIE